MIIDFHTHIFPHKIVEKTIAHLAEQSGVKPFSSGTAEGLARSMIDAGVAVSVSLPVLTNPKQFDGVNGYAKEINEEYRNLKNRIISFAGIHPFCDDLYGKMEYIKKSGFIGVKIHPDYQQTYIDDERYVKILDCAKNLDLVVVSHAGRDYGFKGMPVMCPPERAINVIKKVRHNKFVLAHYGGLDMWDGVLNVLAGEGAYFDTSFSIHKLSRDSFVKILEKHGSDRILFATDSPWQGQKEYVNIIKSFSLPKDAEEAILYKNALKLLKEGGAL